MFCSFHLLADKTNNEHLPKPFFECECDVQCSFCHYGPPVMKLLRLVSLTRRMHQQACKDVLRWRQPYPTSDYFTLEKKFKVSGKYFKAEAFGYSCDTFWWLKEKSKSLTSIISECRSGFNNSELKSMPSSIFSFP